MSVNKFKFVSPGVFVDEIDQSQLPAIPTKMGPVIIGRAERGPAMRPITVNSFAEFVEIFGDPIPGGYANDVWRNGNHSGPTYGAFAAQAYLRNSNPVTFVRLLGKQHTLADSSLANKGQAGWSTKNEVNPSPGSSGGSYGLWVIESGSVGTNARVDDALKITGGTVEHNDAFTVLVPAAAGGYAGDITITVLARTSMGSTPSANQIHWLLSGTDAAKIANLKLVFNGTTDTTKVKFGSSFTNTIGVKGLTASDGVTTTDSYASLAADFYGTAGNTIALTDTVGSVLVNESALTSGKLAGGTHGAQLTSLTGTLAAVWYLNEATIELFGTVRHGAASQSGSCVFINSLGGTEETTEFRALIKDTSGNKIVNTSFNFDPTSDKYIRKVFNTNPTLTNSDIYSTTQKYWLGETFDRAVGEKLTANGAGKAFGVILGISSGSYEYSKQRKESVNAETGWIISQDLGNVTANTANDFDGLDQDRAKRLFRFIALDTGEWNQNNLKVSIADIEPAVSDTNWPTFSVELRQITDHDKGKQVVEKYSNLNMNPSSPNYIARRIGTRYTTWNATDKRLEYHGDYENISKFMRIAMHEDGPTREHLPFGSYGPIRFKGFTIKSGSAGKFAQDDTFVEASLDIAHTHASASIVSDGIYVGPFDFNGSFEFPAVPLRKSGSEGGISIDTKAYFGADTTKRAAANIRYNASVGDIVRTKPGQSKDVFDIVDSPITTGVPNAERSWIFTLDDIKYDNTTQRFYYASGSRQLGKSWTALSGTNNLLTASDAGINKFTTVFYGGFDGLDIKEREPFRNEDVLSAAGDGGDEKLSYAYHTLMRAIDLVRDAEQVECNLMAIPGVTNKNITERLVRTCEERSDALAIIDIENDFVPDTENTSDASTRQGDVPQAVRAMQDRTVDSSYGAAYYPWVQINDRRTGVMFWCPPSVVAMGAMAYSEAVRNVWFAPAGFSRGGLTATGAGGLTVTGVRQHLTSKQRDQLYEVNVNPIASFPAEGIVIFGQKTLQLTPSALDRVNVRRLLIFLKKEISRIAAQTLFEQNIQETWNGFASKADSVLSSVKLDFGLTEYRLVLDETTTTPELIDRNIMYAKIFLKPARAIEFIALDFIITSAGASFED